MRRAVSEQINALKDLSRIVEESGRAFDVGGSTGGKKPQARSDSAETRYSAGPSVDTAPDLRGGLDLAPPPIAPRASEAPRQYETASSDGGGWVSDLLKRASSDEPAQPQRAPAQTVDSLNSLSVDIARAIDHEAASQLWERYRRGERDIFTRRLYTLAGQRTFDEIKARYTRDGAFRTSVDRYIRDFERLLGDVARNDRDGLMTQTYLTSDTGKVYTMLAHASGRLA